ncbi:MAG: hypothetical protein JNM94_02140 [Phycisphaerae bacterium]|nr:hypothetical protein [Phycisphaerae bacterium]
MIAPRHGAMCASIAALIALALTGCAPKAETPEVPPPTDDVATVPPEPAPAAAAAPPSTVENPANTLYATAIARQDERLRRLRFLDSRGLVEFRWVDSEGKHFEQCDLRLHAVLPSKASIQASHSLKGPIARIGSDGVRWWIFRFDTKPTRLEVRPFDRSTDLGMAVVSPREALGLFGLAPYPPADLVAVREEGDALIVEPTDVAALSSEAMQATHASPLRSLPLRYRLDRSTLLPTEITLLDPEGGVAATCTLERYESAPADDTSAGDYPKVPTKIKVVRPGNEHGESSVSFSLDSPTARSAGIKPRLFDLVELQSILQPDDVIWDAGAVPLEPEAPSAK